MAPGTYNPTSKNHGGGHTGDGKKKHTGIYRTGYRFKREPNIKFKVGTKVQDIRTNNVGIVTESNKKRARTLIYIQFNSKCMYINTKYLLIINNDIINRSPKVHSEEYKQKTEEFIKSKIEESKALKKKQELNNANRKNFLKYKKEFNSKVSNLILINEDNKFIKIDTSNGVINEYIDCKFKKLIEFEKKLNKKVSSIDVNMSKYLVLNTFNNINLLSKDKYIQRYVNELS